MVCTHCQFIRAGYSTSAAAEEARLFIAGLQMLMDEAEAIWREVEK